MSTRPEVISEIRSLFKEGATPSRLIRHIVERHEGERSLHSLIQAYFLEAFGVAIVRGLSPVDDFHHADLRYAFLNEHLLHEMIQKRDEWNKDGDDVTNGADLWLNSLRATDDQRRIHEAQDAMSPDLSRIWPQLTPDERHFIQVTLASANGLFEMVKILARLTECLQRRIVELEAAFAPALDDHSHH